MEPQKLELVPRKAPKQRRSKATVDAILEATARVLVKEGYDKASTNRIAKVAGVSIGSLYQYFPSKESLVVALIEQHCGNMLQLLSSMVADLVNAPIDTAVRAYVRAMLQAHAVEPELEKALLSQVMHIGRHIVFKMEKQAQQVVRAYLEQRKDEILPDNLELAALTLVTAVEAITHRVVLEAPDRLASPELEDEICALVSRYLIGHAPAPAA